MKDMYNDPAGYPHFNDSAEVNTQSRSTVEANTNINRKLSQLSTTRPKYSICKVHGELRSVNDKAYEPNIIAIGPYHRDKDNLKVMEEHKLWYLHLILQRKNESTADIFVSAVGELYQEARKCYAEPINLSDSEYIEMLVLDGCFIIELVRKFTEEVPSDPNDVLFQMEWIMCILRRDLMLFENQIPFFVLCKLFDLIKDPGLVEVPGRHDRLIFFLLSFFANPYAQSEYKVSETETQLEIKHLLHLIHINWLPPSGSLHIGSNETIEGKNWKCFQFGKADNVKKKETWIQSARKLREANVKFKRSKSDSFFKIEFENGVLSLPYLRIEDSTEDFFRNVIAYEQYSQDKEDFVTDYVTFMDNLINSSRDVEILSRRGIIDNWLGDDEMIANMFNKLTESITVNSAEHSIYARVYSNVKKHYHTRKNWWMKMLVLGYCSSPWKVISVIAATLLLLLTFIQTVCSIKQVNWTHKNGL